MKITPERIAEVDRKYKSPEQRAEEIWAALQLAAQELDYDFTLYDVTCFAAQWLGTAHLSWATEDEELLKVAIAANRWVQFRHYIYAEEMFEGGKDGLQRPVGETMDSKGKGRGGDGQDRRERPGGETQ